MSIHLNLDSAMKSIHYWKHIPTLLMSRAISLRRETTRSVCSNNFNRFTVSSSLCIAEAFSKNGYEKWHKY